MGVRAKLLSCVVILGIAISPIVTQAQPWKEVQKLRASDMSCDDEFGSAIDSQGSSVIIGAPGSGFFGRPGVAYVFRKENDGWVQDVRLRSSDGDSGRDFGTAVAIDGNTAVVGDDEWVDRFGVVYIFEREEDLPIWQETKRIQLSDSGFFDHFGAALDLFGDTLAVAASNLNDAQGVVYIYDRDQGGLGNWGEVTNFFASDSVGGDRFGGSVALGSANRLVVGASTHGEDIEGAAYVFERDPADPENWVEVAKLLPSGAANRLGTSVAIDGDRILVGGWGSPAYVFERDAGGSWNEIAILRGQPSHVFGYSVGLAQDLAVVGDMQDDDRGQNAGAAFVFGRDEGGADNWGRTKFFSSDIEPIDIFGYAVAVNGNTIFVGAPSDDDASPGSPNCDSGSVYVGGGPFVFMDGFESGDTTAWSSTTP